MSTKIWELPEECVERILLRTSPEDILRSAAVSKQFYSAAVSASLWKQFLPSDYDQIIKESSTPLPFNSLKDLFLLLYRSHILIDQNTKSFNLDKRSQKKCYMLGSRSLTIIWGSTPQYWSWISSTESRFPENAELNYVCWLEIKGQISTKSLSPNTIYGAYFVFKLRRMRYTGFEHLPVTVSVSKVDKDGHHEPLVTNSVYLKPQRGLPRDLSCPVKREDGWMEIEMGTHHVGMDEGVVLEMALMEIERGGWKRGLLVEGIELRPLD